MEKLQAAIERARAQREDRPLPRKTGSAPTAAPASWSALAPMATDPSTLMKNRIFVNSDGRDAAAFDILRTKMFQICRENDWKRVVVTSPTMGCGKTTTCCNLATSFARQSDRRVIVFDMDFRRPSIARYMGQSDGQEFAKVLSGEIDFADQAKLFSPNVAMAINYSSSDNPSKLIMQDSTADILNDIEARYKPELMIFDTPPVLVTDDTIAFLKMVDAALIVVGSEISSLDDVDACEKEVAEHTNVMGTVLNRCRYATESYGYQFGY